MLEIKDLLVNHTDDTLFSGVCFTLNAGEIIHIQGANGSGKTTLLNVLTGIRTPDNGHVLFNGKSIYADLINYTSNLCYVGHKTGVNQNLTARNYCRFDLNIDTETCEKWLENIGLLAHADIPCRELSFGQRRLISLLRLNKSFKPIWLLDEPFVGLDERALQALVLQLKNHLQAAGRVILTSHQTIPGAFTHYSRYQL